MDYVLSTAAVLEAFTGLALLVLPQIVVRLFFGADPAPAGVAVSRIAGAALVGLAIACWPRVPATDASGRAYGGMLTYSAVVSLCLAYAGIAEHLIGPLLIPGVVLHLILNVLLSIAWLTTRARTRSRETSLPPL